MKDAIEFGLKILSVAITLAKYVEERIARRKKDALEKSDANEKENPKTPLGCVEGISKEDVLGTEETVTPPNKQLDGSNNLFPPKLES